MICTRNYHLLSLLVDFHIRLRSALYAGLEGVIVVASGSLDSYALLSSEGALLLLCNLPVDHYGVDRVVSELLDRRLQVGL